MINSESSDLKQIVWGNIPPNTYFSEEEHVQMFSGACPRHITRAMLMPRYLVDCNVLKLTNSWLPVICRSSLCSFSVRSSMVNMHSMAYVRNDQWAQQFSIKDCV